MLKNYIMKKYILLLLLFPVLFACDDNGHTNNNPYLPNYNFSIDINTDFPLYSKLQFTANPVYISQAGIGINGIIVMNTGSGYAAWEASCPNQELTSCSRLIIHGVNAVCPCDDQEYSLFTGDAKMRYPLKPYRVQIISQNVIRVYN